MKMNTPTACFRWCLTLLAGFALIASPSTASATDTKEDTEAYIQQLTQYLEMMQIDDTSSIPAAILRRAKGIIILSEIRAGFIVGVRKGGGVALVRKEGALGGWSAPAFMQTLEGSAGLQIGGQRQLTVILIMNDQGMKVFTEQRFRIGVDAQAVAGPREAGAEARLQPDIPMLVYGVSEGLFAGATVEGGTLGPDDEANRVHYGEVDITMRDILFGDGKEKSVAAGALEMFLMRWDAQAGR